MYLGVLFIENGCTLRDRIQCYLAGFGIYNAKRLINMKNMFVSFMCEEPPTNLIHAKSGNMQLLVVYEDDTTCHFSVIRSQGQYYWVAVKGAPVNTYKETMRSKADEKRVNVSEGYLDNVALFIERTLIMTEQGNLPAFCLWLIKNLTKKEWHS